MKTALLLVSLLLLANSGTAQVPTQITVLGDRGATGNVEGVLPWPSFMERPFELFYLPIVTNLSSPELTTAGALDLVRRGEMDLEQDFYILQFGLSDSFVDIVRGAREPRVARTQFASNLREIILAINPGEHQRKVILVTPYPLRWTEPLKSKLGHPPYDTGDPLGLDHMVALYATEIRAIAAAMALPLVDVHRVFSRRDRIAGHFASEMLADGENLNELGQQAVLQLVARAMSFREPFVPGSTHTARSPWFATHYAWAGRPDYSIPIIDISGQKCRQHEVEKNKDKEIGKDISRWIPSPDGTQLAALSLNRKPLFGIKVEFSTNEEGDLMNKRCLPSSIAGEEHAAAYASDGRLVVVFIDDSIVSPTYGDFVAWVGEWENLKDWTEGEYRIRLLDCSAENKFGDPMIRINANGGFIASVRRDWKEGKILREEVEFKLSETDLLLGDSWERR